MKKKKLENEENSIFSLVKENGVFLTAVKENKLASWRFLNSSEKIS